MGQTGIGLTPTETRRFDVDRPKDWQPSIRSQDEVDDLWWDRLLNKGQRASNTFMDMFTGSTPQEEVEIGLDPSNMVGGAMLSMNSPLRDPVYRAKMLEQFMEQIGRFPEASAHYEPVLRRLTETHPRTVAAFQHAGGSLDSPLVGMGDAAGLYQNTNARLPEVLPPNKGFTSFSGQPQVSLTPIPAGRTAAEVVPHEFAHFAQDLRGMGHQQHNFQVRAHKALDKEHDIMGTWKRFREGGGRHGYEGKPIQGSAPMTDEQYQRHNAWYAENRRLNENMPATELGAERTATKQRERFERWKRGEADWDKYKGIGMERGQPERANRIEARHLTPDQLIPGKRDGLGQGTAVRNRWDTEQRAMMERRRDQRALTREERNARTEASQVRRPLLNFWPFN